MDRAQDDEPLIIQSLRADRDRLIADAVTRFQRDLERLEGKRDNALEEGNQALVEQCNADINALRDRLDAEKQQIRQEYQQEERYLWNPRPPSQRHQGYDAVTDEKKYDDDEYFPWPISCLGYLCLGALCAPCFLLAYCFDPQLFHEQTPQCSEQNQKLHPTTSHNRN
jgi:hypothetical protein